jgi:hypothetical protein
MASEPDMTWLQQGILGGVEPGNRQVFGVIREARVIEPRVSAFFAISCSDKTVIEGELVYTLNPCEGVGSLVILELSPDNCVGARRFKAVEDMLDAHNAKLTAEERQKRSRAKRKETLAEKERERNEMMERILHRKR